MAVTKSAGRVSIRVLPDTRGFRNDLRDYLKNIERSMRVKIKAQPVVDKTALNKMKQEIEELMIKIKPTIDLEVSKEQIEEIKAKIERMRPEVNVMLNTARAATRMANLTRTRTVTIVPTLSRAAMANVAARLGALGGFNVLGDTFKEAGDWLRNIDRISVKMGTLSTLISGVAASVGALTGNMLVIGGQILDVVGLTSVLPALAISTGIVIGSLVAVLKDAGEVLSEYGPAFTQLQDAMSENYWSHLILPIRSLYRSHFPQLSRSLIDVSNALGLVGEQIVETFQEHVTVERMKTMFDRLTDAIKTSADMVDPLMHAFTMLGLHGTKYLGRLSDWMVKLSEDFDDFITKAYNDGSLERWTEQGIQAMKDLGRVTKATYDIFDQLARAAEAAGAADLSDLAAGMEAWAKQMSTPAFQSGMTQYFEGFFLVIRGITEGLRGLGPALGDFAPTFVEAMGSVGEVFETVLGYLGEVLEHPVFQKGVTDFFEGIEQGVKNLDPAIGAFSSSLGGTLSLLGTVAENLGNLLSTVLIEWGPSLDIIGAELETLVEPLSEGAQNIIKDLTPAFETLANEVVPPLVAMIRDELIPLLEEIGEIAGPVLKVAFEELAQFISDDLTPLLQEMNKSFDESEGDMNDFETAFRDTITNIEGFFNTAQTGGWVRGGWLIDPSNWIKDREDINHWFNKNINVPMETAFNNLVEKVFGEARWKEEVNQWFEANLNDPIRSWFESLPAKFDVWWADFWEQFWSPFNEQTSPAEEAWNKLGEAFNQGMEDWYNGLKGWFQDTFTAGWDQMWSDLLGPPTETMETERASMGGVFDQWGADLDAWALRMGESWNLFWGETLPVAWTNFTTWFGEGWNLFWGETVPTAWNDFVVWLSEGWNLFWGTTLPEGWNTFTTTMSEGWTNFWTVTIPEIWNGFVAWLTETWNTFWTGLGEGLSTHWANFQERVNTGITNIQADIEGFGAVVGELWATLWENVHQQLSDAWDRIVGRISEATGISEADIRNFAANALSFVVDGFSQIVSNVQTFMGQFEQNVQTGINNAVSWLQELPGRAVAAIGDLSSTLYNSGAALVVGFINGMASRIEDIRTTAGNLMQAARDFFPGSPAKEGPFSGRGWTPYSGAALVDGFAEGMTSRMGAARDAARKVMEAVDLSAVSDNFNDLDGNGVVIDRREVNVHTYNPVAEPTSRTIEKASSELRMAGAI